MARCQTSVNLKTWWKAMSKDDKREWYKKNKRANAGKIGTFQRRDFDMPTYTETDIQGDHQNDDDLDQWIPYEVYCERKHCQGHKPDQFEAMWKAEMADPNRRKRKHKSGVDLLHYFAGMETRTGSHHSQQRETGRQAILTNVEQLQSLEEPAAKKSRLWSESLQFQQNTALAAQPSIADANIKGTCSFPIKAPSVLKQQLKAWVHHFPSPPLEQKHTCGALHRASTTSARACND
jgi:hypothetical protein